MRGQVNRWKLLRAVRVRRRSYPRYRDWAADRAWDAGIAALVRAQQAREGV